MQTAVLVTGAVRNTGLCIARKFLQQGRTVFITSRDLDSVKQQAQQLRKLYQVDCFAIKYDPLDSQKSAQEMFDSILATGYLVDTLICAHADPGFDQNPLEIDLEMWENVILTNVMGSYMPARLMAKHMAEANMTDGAVVFIGSTVADNAVPHRSAYVSSKGALASMTKALALDFAKLKIRVNCVVPGPIRTDRWDIQPALATSNPIPTGELTAVEQVANIAWFLASDASSGMTGSSVVIDGGLNCVVPGAY